MPLTREQKKKIIEDLKEKVAKQKAMVFVSIQGIKAKELFDLRKKLKTFFWIFKRSGRFLLK